MNMINRIGAAQDSSEWANKRKFSMATKAIIGVGIVIIGITIYLIQSNDHSDAIPTKTNEAILIYSMEEYLSWDDSKLIQYSDGDVHVFDKVSYEEWLSQGGHQPWRREPLMVLQSSTTNLIPTNISLRENLVIGEWDWPINDNIATNRDGVSIKIIAPAGEILDAPTEAKELTYEMFVPEFGTYEITMVKPEGSWCYVIGKIIFKQE